MALISQAAARYRPDGGREHCSICRHFIALRGGSCKRVEGRISPRGWCKLFSQEVHARIADVTTFSGGGGGPALGLDFMVPGVLDPRITFTRASTATYFDSAGVMQTAAINAPRWDYDPATLALRGLLLEEARTNLLLNSATLSTQSVTVTAVAYTLSFTGTGTITKSGTATGALVGTGAAQRVSQTFTPTAGSLTLTVTGTVSNAQIEAGDFATSYIPTSTVAVTRSIDSCLIPPANMSPWFTPPGGSWFSEFDYFDSTPNNGRVIGRIGFPNGASPMYINSTRIISQYDGGTVMNGGTSVVSVVNKIASTWAPGQAKLCLNGGTVNTSASLATGYGLLATDGITLMTATAGGLSSAVGHIRAVRYWPAILTDAQMQATTAP